MLECDCIAYLKKKHFLQGGIHFARNQIATVAMFLCHTRSPLLVVQEKPLPVVQEKLKTFNVAQAFGTSILSGLWGIHLARGCPFGWEPDYKSCHVSMSCKVTSTG